MDKLKEYGYSVLSFLGIYSSILPLIYTLIFWIRYQWICNWAAKWSRGEFTAPEKRLNFNMLHGLGALAMIAAGFVIGSMGFISLMEATVGFFEALTLIGLVLGFFAAGAGLWGYWTLVCKYSKAGLTPKGNAFKIGYGTLTLVAWAIAVVLAIYAVIAVVCIVVGYFLLKFILFACFSEEITVKRGGFFGGTKKVQATRNFDGTYTDLDGNTYK